MSDTEIHHLGAAYALDALDPRERQAFEAHFATCDICRVDVAEFRATAVRLGELVSERPPASLKASIMSEIAETRQFSPLPVTQLADHRRRRAVVVLASVAAALALFLAGAVIAGRGGDDFGDQLATIMSDPTAQTVRLGGEGPGTISVTWAGGRAAVVAAGLPDPGDGKAYELWLIDGAGAHALSLLDPADDGSIERVVDAKGSPAAWGVTIESDEGSPTPTEPILFVAETSA